MLSHNNGLGHRDHDLSSNVTSQPFEFPDVKPYAITFRALVYNNPMSDFRFIGNASNGHGRIFSFAEPRIS